MSEVEFHVDEIWQVPAGVRTAARRIVAIVNDNVKFSTLGSKRINSINIKKMREWVERNQAFLATEESTIDDDASINGADDDDVTIDESPIEIGEISEPSTIVREPMDNTVNSAPIARQASQAAAEHPAYLPPASKTMLFIDGQSLFYTQRTLGFSTDFKLLREYFSKFGYLARSYFYSAYPAETSPIFKLCEWMQYNDYTVHHMESGNSEYAAVDTALAMALDVIEQTLNNLDNAILIVNHAAFSMVMQRAKRFGCHITLVGSIAEGCRMADNLRREADSFIDLRSIMPHIQRPNREANG
jgi:uncharacterized LabA/DUF88 family protein